MTWMSSLEEERRCSSTWEPGRFGNLKQVSGQGLAWSWRRPTKRWRRRRRRWSHHRGLSLLCFLPVGDGSLGLVRLQCKEAAGWLQNLPDRRRYSVKVRKRAGAGHAGQVTLGRVKWSQSDLRWIGHGVRERKKRVRKKSWISALDSS